MYLSISVQNVAGRENWGLQKNQCLGYKLKLDSHGDRRLFRKSNYIPRSLKTLFYECLFLSEFISLSYVYSNVLKICLLENSL